MLARMRPCMRTYMKSLKAKFEAHHDRQHLSVIFYTNTFPLIPSDDDKIEHMYM